MRYWAGVTCLYIFCGGLVWHQVELGVISIFAGLMVIGFSAVGVVSFYFLLRGNEALRVKNWQLTFAQAVFAITYDLVLYVVLEPIRGGVLLGLPLTILLCALSLRPHQTKWLSAFAITALACVMMITRQQRPITHPVYVEFAYLLMATISIIAVNFVTGKSNKLQATLRQQKADVERAAATIRILARTDELTQLSNRRHMKDLLAVEERRAAPLLSEICVAILDVDYFKNINDSYGHAAGDIVLKSFANAAKTALRPTDVLARWGGEEFLLFMPDTELQDAVTVVERVADRIRSMNLPEIAPELKVTFSAGVIQRVPRETFANAIRRSDRAMYVAKNNRRNCIVTG